MSDHVYKSVEITGTSSEGVKEAIDGAIAKASQSLRNLDGFGWSASAATSRTAPSGTTR